LTISNQHSNAVFSNASPGSTVRFLGVNVGGFFFEQVVKTDQFAPMLSINSPTFFLSAHPESMIFSGTDVHRSEREKGKKTEVSFIEI
jgi:hypothetical protein